MALTCHRPHEVRYIPTTSIRDDSVWCSSEQMTVFGAAVSKSCPGKDGYIGTMLLEDSVPECQINFIFELKKKKNQRERNKSADNTCV